MRLLIAMVAVGVALGKKVAQGQSGPTLAQELSFPKVHVDESQSSRNVVPTHTTYHGPAPLFLGHVASGCKTYHTYNGVKRGPYNKGVDCRWPSAVGVDKRDGPCLRHYTEPKCYAPGPPASHQLDDKLREGAVPCSAIQCDHIVRDMGGVRTSSIVVRHACVAGATVQSARGMPVTWPRAGLQSAKSDAQMKARSCIETVCTESHYCGMNGQGKCVCVQGGSEEGGQ